MKSLNKLLLFVLSFGLVFSISSCGDDEVPTPEPGNIQIHDFTANGVTFEEEERMGNHDPGSTVRFTFHTTADDDLKSYKVTKTVNEVEEEILSESLSGSSANVSFDYDISEEEQGGNEILLTFTVESNFTESTETESIDYKIVITRTLKNLVLYENITLGAQKNDDHPHFLSITDGMVYTLAEATANQESVDLAYFDHANLVASFGATGSEKTESVYELEEEHSWTVFNNTRFRQAPWRDESFNNASNDRRIHQEWNNPDGYEIRDYYGNLGANPPVCVLFETADGRLGMILVKNIVVGNQGSITVDIKIQE